MIEKLNSNFSTINPDFEAVKGSRGSIFYDKNNKIAFLVLKAFKDPIKNMTAIMFNSKQIRLISKGQRTGIYEQSFLAIYFQGEFKIINLNKLLKSILPETLLSSIEKSETHTKPNSKSEYYIISYNYHAGYIEVDYKKYRFTENTNIHKQSVQATEKAEIKNNQRTTVKTRNTKTVKKAPRKQKHPRRHEFRQPARQKSPEFHMSWQKRLSIESRPGKNDKRVIKISQAGFRLILSTG
jgi:hypothetical protein